ncbi:hypothetical protein N7468_009905 [Penicillium chermesinum]|uniref:Uncharacterized protein n=1 Tax=Penicillium chermesinum TaxID=63820 RepID=A0A9W9NBN9_9EURO|nr:uncharacterized protein N7468_009905 [Penicillium chermesinum]KAJ5216897.1 hypothetical protein N7468_009905 [Penicillium chermesinum]
MSSPAQGPSHALPSSPAYPEAISIDTASVWSATSASRHIPHSGKHNELPSPLSASSPESMATNDAEAPESATSHSSRSSVSPYVDPEQAYICPVDPAGLDPPSDAGYPRPQVSDGRSRRFRGIPHDSDLKWYAVKGVYISPLRIGVVVSRSYRSIVSVSHRSNYSTADQDSTHTSPPVLTLRVISQDGEFTESGAKAVLEIQDAIRDMTRDLDQPLSTITVDIIHPRLLRPKNMFPVEQDNLIFPQWKDVLEKVLDLRSCPELSAQARQISTIGCVRRGWHEHSDQCPVTILITVKGSVAADWSEFAERVVEILSRMGLPMVAVEIALGGYRTIDYYGGMGYRMRSSSVQSWLGRVLRQVMTLPDPGHLGGFLALSFGDGVGKDAKLEVFGVTCSHVALGAADTRHPPGMTEQEEGPWRLKPKARISGASSQAEVYTVAHPSKISVAEEIHSCTSNIRQCEGDPGWTRAQQLQRDGIIPPHDYPTKPRSLIAQEFPAMMDRSMERLSKLLQQHYTSICLLTRLQSLSDAPDHSFLGTVFASSGAYLLPWISSREIASALYNTKDHCLGMDWALIRLSKERTSAFRLAKRIVEEPWEKSDQSKTDTRSPQARSDPKVEKYLAQEERFIPMLVSPLKDPRKPTGTSHLQGDGLHDGSEQRPTSMPGPEPFLQNGDKITYWGYRSGQMEVRYNSLKVAHLFDAFDADANFTEQRQTLEHCILPIRPGGHSTGSGDSGSFLYTPQEDLAGMIWAGDNSQGFGFFTHIQDLARHIKQVTGCKEVFEVEMQVGNFA